MIYLSYNLGDSASVDYLAQMLRQYELPIRKVTDEIIAGDNIYENIEENIKKSTSVLICFGNSGLGEWQETEILFASNSHIRIIPILLPGYSLTSRHKLVDSLRYVDFSKGFDNEHQWVNLVSALKDNKEIHDTWTNEKLKVERKKFPKNIRAASVLIYHKGKILLLKRSKFQKTGSGLWQLPGGKVKDREDSIDAAIREVEEEVKITIAKAEIMHIVDVVDSWVVKGTGDFITMSLFFCEVSTTSIFLAEEFESPALWCPISELFTESDRIYFGSTERFLRIARRFIFLYLPLRRSAEFLNSSIVQKQVLPDQIANLTVEGTQVLYSFLSLLGFLDDKAGFSSSSTLSISLLKTLSEFSLTESSIFEAQGSVQWLEEARKRNIQEVERFRSGMLSEHKSLLGLLSYRLSKSLSSRTVCDVLLFGTDDLGTSYILIRWDFFANKFQIPAKGLEGIGLDLSSKEVAEYVVKERMSETLVDKFDYQMIGPIRTSHVSAGTLGDGPLMRNYFINIFRLEIKQMYNDFLNETLNSINTNSINVLKSSEEISDKQKMKLPFYVWADIDYIYEKDRGATLLGMKLQGFEEIIDKYGISVFKSFKQPVNITTACKIPLISAKVRNIEQFKGINQFN